LSELKIISIEPLVLPCEGGALFVTGMGFDNETIVSIHKIVCESMIVTDSNDHENNLKLLVVTPSFPDGTQAEVTIFRKKDCCTISIPSFVLFSHTVNQSNLKEGLSYDTSFEMTLKNQTIMSRSEKKKRNLPFETQHPPLQSQNCATSSHESIPSHPFHLSYSNHLQLNVVTIQPDVISLNGGPLFLNGTGFDQSTTVTIQDVLCESMMIPSESETLTLFVLVPEFTSPAQLDIVIHRVSDNTRLHLPCALLISDKRGDSETFE
jgi:hypothetical protein